MINLEHLTKPIPPVVNQTKSQDNKITTKAGRSKILKQYYDITVEGITIIIRCYLQEL